jgi:hypothetical protein
MLGADLALEVQPLLGKLVLELVDLAKRQRVGDGHRDLPGHLLDPDHSRRCESVGLEAADVQRAEHPVADDQRHAAERADALLTNGFGHLGESS